MRDQQDVVRRDSQDEAAPMIRLDDQQMTTVPATDPYEHHRAVGDFFHAMARMLKPPTP